MERFQRSLSLAVAAAITTTSLAGDLTPPAGPVQATDRVVLNAQTITLPHTITQPGSYVLTSDLNATAAFEGIRIASDDVTLDLNGFIIDGGGIGSVGIRVVSPLGSEKSNVTIKNGTVRNWTSSGVAAFQSIGCHFERIRVVENGFGGLLSGDWATVVDCVAIGNMEGGLIIHGGSVAERCVATGQIDGEGINIGSLVVLRNSISTNNEGAGIVSGPSARIENCVAASNQGDGIAAFARTVVTGCTANFNQLNGYTSSSGTIFENCTAADNQASGFAVVGTNVEVIECTARQSKENGIRAENGVAVRNSSFASNSMAGVLVVGEGCRIEGNNVEGNDIGIDVDNPNTPGNLIIRNSAHGNTTGNFNLGASSHGPIIDVSLGGDISFFPGAEHPWANFEY